MRLTVFGSLALDTTRTPFRTEVDIMGGAAAYATLASSKFVETDILGVVGSDFQKNTWISCDQKLEQQDWR